MALPALFEFLQQRQHQLLTQGAWRVERHGLVDRVIDPALGQIADRGYQVLAQRLPFVFDGVRDDLGGVDKVFNLADRYAAVEPSEDGVDALHVFGAEQPMTFGCALGHDQPVAAFPGAQGHGVDAGLARHFTNRQPAVLEGLGDVFARFVLQGSFHEVPFMG